MDARLDEGSYPTGVQVTSGQMAALPVSRHPFHGDWNYTLHPTHRHAAATAAPAAAGDEPGHRAPALRELAGLATAGMS